MSAPVKSYLDLMSLAERNAQKGEKKAQQKVFPVLSKPKKLDPKEKKLSEGIKKFLEQKSKEEKQKAQEAQAKRQHLEELRSQTKGANRRVGQMLRMTKSSNKACMADAQSCINDSLAAQGDFQPDEDDYGYVSQSAQQWHQKLMASYKNIPANTITRRPAAPIPEARTLNPGRVGSSSTKEHAKVREAPSKNEYVPEAKPEKVPPKKKLPVPPSYTELMSMAAQKSKEPVQVKKPVVQKSDGIEFEFGRPMTAKEKAAYQQEKTYRDRIEKGLCSLSSSETNKSASDAPESTVKTSSFKIPSKRTKVATQNTPPPPPKVPKLDQDSKQDSFGASPKMPNKLHNIKQNDPRQRSESVPTQSMKDRVHAEPSKSLARQSAYGNSRDPKIRKEYESPIHETKIKKEPDYSSYESKTRRESDSSAYETKIRRESDTSVQGTKIKKEPDSYNYATKKREPDYETKMKKGPYNSDKPANYSQGNPTKKEFSNKPPPSKISNQQIDDSGKGTSRPNYLPKYAPAPKPRGPPMRERPQHPDSRHMPQRRPPPPKPSYKGGRAVIDSDEEYDSEMDDFIDDSEVDMQTISNEISQIFNYRRDKYIDEDSDDECMESNLEQQMKEERRSLIIGIKEDKEEEMKEKAEEERKRKRMMALKKT